MPASRILSICMTAAVAIGPIRNLSAQVPQPARQTLVTISKETTFLTEPLDADGYVDYLAAVNKRQSEGVTPENNAAVLLRTALGLMEAKRQAFRDQYDRMLGIEPAGEGLFVQLMEVARAEGIQDETEAYNLQSAAQKRPWTADEYPSIAAWLSVNAAALDLVVEATERPRFYTPYIAGDAAPKLFSVLLPALQETREASRTLISRAMWHAGEGDVERAFDDLEAVHRLARLVSQDPTIVGGLVGFALDGMAHQGDVAIVSTGLYTPAELTAYLERLNNLPPFPPMADRLDFIERLIFADFVGSYARSEVDYEALGSLGVGGHGVAGLVQKFPRLWMGGVDWDAILRDGNKWFDRIVEAMSEETFAEQAAALAAIDADVKSLAEGAKSPLRLAALVLSDSKTRGHLVGKQIGDLLVSLLLPATHAAMNAEHRGQMRFDLSRLAVALEVYRATTGEYPETLSALTVEILQEIPRDRFSGDPLRYERREEGYLLYSVGMNAQDDGATSYISGTQVGEHVPEGEEVNSEAGDDLVIRVPLP